MEFNGNHYGKLKGICDWLMMLDGHWSYDGIYNHWNYLITEEKVIELEYLESILNGYLENEEDKAYIRSFKSAIETVVGIQNELINK